LRSLAAIAWVPVGSFRLALVAGVSRMAANYSVKWTAATSHGNLTRTVAAATYLER
jgi:hypothetical protein